MLQIMRDPQLQRGRGHSRQCPHPFHHRARDDLTLFAEHAVDGDLRRFLRGHAAGEELHAGHLVEFGAHRPRAQRRDMHMAAAPAQLSVDRLAQPQHIRLARVIRGHQRSRRISRYARDIEDIAIIPFDEVAQEQLGQDMHRTDIQIDHLQLPIQARLIEGAAEPETGIVDQDIDLFRPDSLIEHAAALLIAQVHADDLGVFS